jgi:hypothetical protein
MLKLAFAIGQRCSSGMTLCSSNSFWKAFLFRRTYSVKFIIPKNLVSSRSAAGLSDEKPRRCHLSKSSSEMLVLASTFVLLATNLVGWLDNSRES